MKKPLMLCGLILATQLLGGPGALASPWEDGMAAYNRGDYVPAIKVFRAMAAQGNARAQGVLGVMYRRRGWPAVRCAPSSGSTAPRRTATLPRKPNCTTSRTP